MNVRERFASGMSAACDQLLFGDLEDCHFGAGYFADAAGYGASHLVYVPVHTVEDDLTFVIIAGAPFE